MVITGKKTSFPRRVGVHALSGHSHMMLIVVMQALAMATWMPKFIDSGVVGENELRVNGNPTCVLVDVEWCTRSLACRCFFSNMYISKLI